MNEEIENNVQTIGTLLLDIGAVLMSSGASSSRIRITVDRISKAFGYKVDVFITHRALTLTLRDDKNVQMYNSMKRTSAHGVNFTLVSGISRMSWRIVEENWTVEQVQADLARLQLLPHYPRLVVLSFVSLAGASFCRLVGGDAIEMTIAFLATFVGLFVRQEAVKLRFNPYFAVLFGAVTAAMLAGGFTRLGNGFEVEHAFAASVLFLIPGIPLINTFTDLIDGNILNGILRLIHGLLIAFMIALGLLIAITVFHL